MTIQTILQYAGEAALCAGPVGTALEFVGKVFKVPALVTIGLKLEGIGADLPEFFGGAKAKALASVASVSGSGRGSIAEEKK